MHDERQAVKRRIFALQGILAYEGIEAAQWPLMARLHVGNIIGNGRLLFGFGAHPVGRNEEEFRVRIDKATDEPGTGDAIDFGPLTRNPVHMLFSFSYIGAEALSSFLLSDVFLRPRESTA